MNSVNFSSAALAGDSTPQSERLRPQAFNLAAFAPSVARAQTGGNRMIGIAAAVAVQAVLLAGLTFTHFAETPPPSEALTVDVLPQEKVEPPPPPPPMSKPVLAAPNIVMAAPPSFQIYEPAPVAAMAPSPSAISTTSTPVSGADKAAIIQDFQIKLLRHLNQNKRYPAIARAKRAQGVVYVRFSMDRRGNVLSAAIEKLCKYDELNAEGLALLTRAQPLPQPPAEVAGDPIEMIVPVEFSLRN